METSFVGQGHIGMLIVEREYETLEAHTADSKWQFCKCRTCQDKRRFLDNAPGDPIDYSTFRHKDERY